MILSDLARMSDNSGLSAHKIVEFIKSDTDPTGFDNKCRKYKDYTLDMASCSFRSSDEAWQTALGAAASVGNTALIEHIVKIGSPSLLSISDNYRRTPLHCAIECADLEKGFESAQRLLQLGSPVNLAAEHGKTPLETSLEVGNIPVAAMLKRRGGVVREEFIPNNEFLDNLEKTKALIKAQDTIAAVFKLCFKDTVVPADVTNYISSLYGKMI